MQTSTKRRTKPKKPSKAKIMRNWGMTQPSIAYLRYRNPVEKGIYWYFFSLYIRTRDVKKYGTCISCGRPITIQTSQAGHFMPASDCGRDLLFDERNVNAECNQCNAWDETHLLGYADNLNRRYGENMAQILRDLRQFYKGGPLVKDWKKEEYEEKITIIKQKLIDLGQL